MRGGSGWTLRWLVTTLMVVWLAAPAWAYDAVEEARDAIYATADQAISDIQSVVSQLEDAAGSMQTNEEVDTATDAAVDEVNDIWHEANTTINGIKNEYPSELTIDANAAKQSVNSARQNATAEIAVVQATYPMASVTTTTTTPQQTTSTAATTTSSSSTPGPTTSTTQATTTTTTTTTTTNDQVSAPAGGTGAPPSDGTSIEEALPGLPESISSGVIEEDLPSFLSDLGIVLPPAIANLVVTPFQIAGIIVRTTVEGGKFVMLPMAILIGSALSLVLFERRRNRQTEHDLLDGTIR